MKSLVGRVLSKTPTSPPATNKAPITYVGRGAAGLPQYYATGAESYLRAMGTVGTLFSIVDRNATSVSAVTWHLYRKAKPGQSKEEREEVTRHAALDVWNKPNDFFTSQLFTETGQQHFELVGETVWVVARNPSFKFPLELWPVRPDRMQPVPGVDDYLVGWIYRSPDGQQIPLNLDQVIQIRRPNPYDAYRGIGAVQTIRAELDGVTLSAEWNRNFFLNSAEPGGIVEIEERLTDEEFEEMSARWREQHQGVNNAHRVAIIEQGKWIERKYTKADMQFAENREVTSKIIREAFGMPAFALGEVQDINRATAEAAMLWFAQQITVPRLERIKQALNSRFLPMFGTTAQGLEFDYESPVPEDEDAEVQRLETRARAAQIMIDSGVYGPEALAAVGLPDMSFGEPNADKDRELLIRLVTRAPLLAPTILPLLGFDLPNSGPDQVPEPVQARAERVPSPDARLMLGPSLPALEGKSQPSDVPDLSYIKADEAEALERLLTRFEPVVAAWNADLVAQAEAAAAKGDVQTLGSLSVDIADASEVIRVALAEVAQRAAERMAEECAEQGVDVSAPAVDEALRAHGVHHMVAFGAELVSVAAAVAQVLADGLSLSASAEAVRLFVPGVSSGQKVAAGVREFLGGLKGQFRRSQLGGVVHRATNAGRMATLKAALKVRPGGRIVSDEQNDRNTCPRCKDIDGTVFASVAEAQGEYPGGGYWACEGREKCRGTFRVAWGED